LPQAFRGVSGTIESAGEKSKATALGNLLATLAMRAEKVKIFSGVSQALRKNQRQVGAEY